MMEFNDLVFKIKESIKPEENEKRSEYLKFKSEIFVESLKDWSLTGDINDLKIWFEKKQKKLTLKLEDIPLKDCLEWKFDEKGYFSHSSGEFFFLQGLKISSASSREVGGKGWYQPMITQVGFNGGILGLIRKKIKGVPHYLIEAKAEPGNPDGVQISPTLQATFSNLKMAHEGRKPNYSDFFEKFAKSDFSVSKNEKIHFCQWMSEDGGRLHLKRNLGVLLELDENFEIDIKENFRFISLFQIKELIKENSWINPHIRSIISSL